MDADKSAILFPYLLHQGKNALENFLITADSALKNASGSAEPISNSPMPARKNSNILFSPDYSFRFPKSQGYALFLGSFLKKVLSIGGFLSSSAYYFDRDYPAIVI